MRGIDSCFTDTQVLQVSFLILQSNIVLTFLISCFVRILLFRFGTHHSKSKYGSLRHRTPIFCILEIEGKGVYVAQVYKSFGWSFCVTTTSISNLHLEYKLFPWAAGKIIRGIGLLCHANWRKRARKGDYRILCWFRLHHVLLKEKKISSAFTLDKYNDEFKFRTTVL